MITGVASQIGYLEKYRPNIPEIYSSDIETYEKNN